MIQFHLGITNGTDKALAHAADVGKVVVAAADPEAQQRKLKKSWAELEASEILEKGRVEELIRLSEDRTLSAADRLAKLREAGKLEGEVSAKSLKQISDEPNAIKQRNVAKSLTKEDAIKNKITEQKQLLLAVQEGSAAELVIK